MVVTTFLLVLAILASTDAYHVHVQSKTRASVSGLKMEADGYDYKKKQMSHDIKESKKSGAGFNYDPSNYRDSANEGNYRRLSDQIAAVKAEEDKMAREREEIVRKAKMEKMLMKQENETFWNTPGDLTVATSDKFFVPPNVIQVIDDLDNQVRSSNIRLSLYLRLSCIRQF